MIPQPYLIHSWVAPINRSSPYIYLRLYDSFVCVSLPDQRIHFHRHISLAIQLLPLYD